MPIVLVALTFFMVVLTWAQLSLQPKNDAVTLTVGAYDKTTQKLQNSFTTVDPGRSAAQEPKIAARNANVAALRICRAVSREMKDRYLAGDVNCSNYGDSTVLLGFVGTAGTTGSLDTLYTQSTATTLTCSSAASIANYGRYLFSRSLPKNLISGKNVNYNLVGITNGRPDPCGYNEIIY